MRLVVRHTAPNAISDASEKFTNCTSLNWVLSNSRQYRGDAIKFSSAKLFNHFLIVNFCAAGTSSSHPIPSLQTCWNVHRNATMI